MLRSLLLLGILAVVAFTGRPLLARTFGVVFSDFQFALLFALAALGLLYRRRVMSR